MKKYLSYFLVCITALICNSTINVFGQVTYPSISYAHPVPEPSVPGDLFTPPLQGQAASGTPRIAEWTRTAGPDESVVLTADNLSRYSAAEEGKDTRFVVYGNGGVTREARIQRLDGAKAVLTLDSALPRASMYLLWPGNENGWGTPVAVNKTDAWWAGPSRAVAGATVSVYGRNLSYNNDTLTSHVYLRAAGGAGQWAQVKRVNPYRVEFTLPSSLSAGDYELWVHNGHGGHYGWSGPLKLTVDGGPTWSTAVYNVQNYGATGNGTSDDRSALNAALAAAGSSGATLYLPAGTYMVSGPLNLSSNTRWVGAVDGQGNPATTIKLMAGYSPGPFGLMGAYGLANNYFENLAFVRNGQNVGQELMNMQNATMMWWNNCVIDARGADAMRFTAGSCYIFMNGTTLIGGRDQWGTVLFLDGVQQFFAHGCTFKMTNDCTAAIINKGVKEASLTTCVVKDLDNSTADGSGWGKGRFWSATGAGGSAYHCYFADNTGTGLGTRRTGSNTPDPNSGEIFLWEANATQFQGVPVAATASSVSFGGAVPQNVGADPSPKPQSLVVVKGKGMGQFRRITANNGSGVLTIDRPWEVIPDGSSQILAGPFVDRIVVYRNSLDANGKGYIATDGAAYGTASAGIEPYGGCFDFVADGNVMQGIRRGISLWATQHYTMDPSYFNLFTRNRMINCRVGLHNASEVTVNSGTALLGAVYRGNVVQSPVLSGIHNEVKYADAPVFSTMAYEHNSFTGVPAGFSTGSLSNPDPRLDYGAGALENQVLYKNEFSGTGTAVKVTPKVVLRENKYQGFTPLYTAGQAVLEAPLRVVELGVAAGSTVKAVLEVANSGSTPLVWSGVSSASWLGLSVGSGSLPGEGESSAVELTASAKALGVGTYRAFVTLSSPSAQAKTYTVILSVTSSSSAVNPSINLTSPTPNQNFIAPAGISVTADASDSDGTVAKVEFFNGSTKLGEDLTSPYSFTWNNVAAGSYSITAKATDNSGLSSTSQQIDIKVSNPVVPPAVSITSPVSNSIIAAPATVTITADASAAEGISKVEFFNGSTKLGEDLTSPYSFTWSSVAAGSYSITAKATDNSGLITTAQQVNITVNVPAATSSCPGTGSISWDYWLNVPWTNAITIPVNTTPASSKTLSSFTTPVDMGDYYAARVRGYICPPATGNYTFFLASDDLGELWLSTDNNPANKQKIASVAPWTDPGQYDLYPSQKSKTIYLQSGQLYYIEALVQEEWGGDHLSVGWQLPDGTMQRPIQGANLVPYTPIVIPVAPVISLSSSATATTAPANITFTATASDSDGTVAKVEFFNGSTKLGEDLTSPYSFTWNNVAAGSYSITAKATDNSGLSATSQQIDIKVSNPVVPPAVSITSPVSNSIIAAPATVTITADASAAEGISKVEFFNGSTKLGEDLTSPYSFTWSSVAAGSYSITAKATANTNLTTISQVVTVTVNAPVTTGCAGTGSLTWEYWLKVPWTGVLTVPVNKQPTGTKQLTSFSAPVNMSEKYASRARGYICPPTTGDYIFYIAADDLGELWLSTDDNPANKQKIAYVSNWVNEGQYDKYASQQSKKITLKAGQRYYIEALHQDNYGSSSLSVGWKLPNGTLQRPIPGSNLIPYTSLGIASMANTDNSGIEEAVISKVDNLQAYPNPFQGNTKIEFSVSKSTTAKLQLFTLQGILVNTLYSGHAEAGKAYRFDFNGSNLANGMYISRLVYDNVVLQKQLIMMK